MIPLRKEYWMRCLKIRKKFDGRNQAYVKNYINTIEPEMD